MRVARVLMVLLLVGGTGEHAAAGGVLDRVKARGSVRCGGFERPGLAAIERNAGDWQGLEVDVCRAVAMAVLGAADKISFHGYDGAADKAALVQGADDVAFLTGSEIAANRVSVLPGPAVFVESHALMVPATASERHVADLPRDAGICFRSGSPLERSLPAFFAALGKRWRPFSFSEDGEMLDAYNVRRCHAIAGELTTLAALRGERGINGLRSRILPEPLMAYPILATTGAHDGEWSAIVAWTVYTLIAADRPAGQWHTGGADAMPAPLTELGTGPGWQARVIGAVGTYRAMFERDVGAASALRLPPGLNAAPAAGGALSAPAIE